MCTQKTEVIIVCNSLLLAGHFKTYWTFNRSYKTRHQHFVELCVSLQSWWTHSASSTCSPSPSRCFTHCCLCLSLFRGWIRGHAHRHGPGCADGSQWTCCPAQDVSNQSDDSARVNCLCCRTYISKPFPLWTWVNRDQEFELWPNTRCKKDFLFNDNQDLFIFYFIRQI